MVNVICMKYFKRYGPHYVNRLRRAVQRHLQRLFRFVCFTDSAGVRIVAFHGRPDPDEAVAGFKDKPHRSCRPATWIHDHWR